MMNVGAEEKNSCRRRKEWTAESICQRPVLNVYCDPLWTPSLSHLHRTPPPARSQILHSLKSEKGSEEDFRIIRRKDGDDLNALCMCVLGFNNIKLTCCVTSHTKNTNKRLLRKVHK